MGWLSPTSETIEKRQSDLEYWEGRPFGRDPWERQPCDTDMSWRFFQVYRDIPFHERSVQKAVQIVVDSDEFPGRQSFIAARTDLLNFSRANGWVARAKLWDAELDRAARDEDLRQTAIARRQARKAARKVVSIAGEALEQATADQVNGPMEAARLLELGAKLAGLGEGWEWEQADGKQLRELFAKVVQAAVRQIGDESLPAENRQAQFVAEVNVLVAEALGR